jgi:hypothetical protein
LFVHPRPTIVIVSDYRGVVTLSNWAFGSRRALLGVDDVGQVGG